jgi:two-component system response regulator YesN
MSLFKMFRRSIAWFSSRYYIRLVAFGSATAMITVLILSLISYAVTSQHLENQVNVSSLETVKQIQMSLDNRLESVQRALSPLLQDADLLDAVYVEAGGVDYLKFASIVKKLQALEQAFTDMYSVDIFIPDVQILLSTKDGYQKYSAKEYAEQLASKEGWGYGRPFDNLNVLSLVKAVPLFADKPKAYLAVYLKPSFLLQAAGDISRLGSLTVVDAKGFLVLDPASGGAGNQLSSDLLDRFLNRGASAGIIQVNNQDDVSLYANLSFNGWTVMLEVPNDTIYGFHKRLILIYTSICGLGLLLGALLIYIQSRKLYKPIHELVEEMGGPVKPGSDTNEWQIIRNQLKWKDKQLDELNAQHQIFVRDQFFLDLLYGHFVTVSADSLDRQLELHGLAPGFRYGVMIVESERIEESNRFRKDEKPLVVLAVSSICKDILQQMQLGGLVLQAVQAGHVILLLQVNDTQSEQVSEVHYRLAESIRVSVQSFLKFPVSVGIGAYHEGPDGLRRSYNEAQEALQYRLTEGGNRILRFEDRSRKAVASRYPVELEKLMLEVLREGNREDVLRVFNDFVLHTVSDVDKGETIYLYYHMLYTALSQYYIHQSEANRTRFMKLFAFSAIHECQTVHELESFFVHSLLPILFDMAEEERSGSTGKIVESVLKWLPDHLGEDLSLPRISENFKVSPSYFSRIFARQIGTTFVEYVSGLRIEAAKVKLAETDLPMQVIAREIGYTEQTFRRVFKQITALTPTQYRESQRKR